MVYIYIRYVVSPAGRGGLRVPDRGRGWPGRLHTFLAITLLHLTNTLT